MGRIYQTISSRSRLSREGVAANIGKGESTMYCYEEGKFAQWETAAATTSMCTQASPCHLELVAALAHSNWWRYDLNSAAAATSSTSDWSHLRFALGARACSPGLLLANYNKHNHNHHYVAFPPSTSLSLSPFLTKGF